MKRAIIHLGGSPLQMPGLRWTRAVGLEVLLCDARAEVPGRALATESVVLGAEDVAAQVAQAREWARRYSVAGAYCSGDHGLRAVAAIGEALGLEVPALAATECALDKVRALAVLRAAGVPVPRGRALGPEEEDAPELTLPVVVKPVGSSGSRGVRVVRERGEMAVAVRAARLFDPAVVVEEMVEGEHVDVSGFFADGRFFPGGQLDRFFSPLPHRYPVWGMQPRAVGNGPEEASIYDLLERAARALGIHAGPVKADCIVTPHGPVLLEVAPRFHGDTSTSFVCPLAYGISPVQQWFEYLATGRTPGHEVLAQPEGVAGWMGIFPPEAGTLVAIKGVETAARVEGVAEVYLHRAPGYRVAAVADNLALLGFIWARAADREELVARLQAARAALRVVMED
jgi:biotin carboxylase